jgi:lysophospholipase L1-like esterase
MTTAVMARSLASDPSSNHDFSRWQPQLVVVQVGGNDLYGGKEAPSRDAFIAAYVSLLQCVRAHRPKPAVILNLVYCLETPSYDKMGARDGKLFEYTAEAVRLYKEGVGGCEGTDELVHIAAFPDAGLKWPQDGGVIEHWGTAGHIKWADALCHYIETDLPLLLPAESAVASWKRRPGTEGAKALVAIDRK